MPESFFCKDSVKAAAVAARDCVIRENYQVVSQGLRGCNEKALKEVRPGLPASLLQEVPACPPHPILLTLGRRNRRSLKILGASIPQGKGESWMVIMETRPVGW